jgi:choline dehydrogenase-like flavoprotein
MMNSARAATLRAVVETLAPPGARIDRITSLASQTIDERSPARRAELGQLLDLLRLPMLATHATRAGVLLALAGSPVAKLRTGFNALKRLTLLLAYAEGAPGDDNPLWAACGYPGPRNDRSTYDTVLPLTAAREGERVSADVVVIGSGAGGGLVAGAFARAGKRVVVLEAGAAFDATTFTQRETSLADLYLDGGNTASKDLGVTILAGGTLGGGTTINWSTSLRLPERIGAEWEAESGIAGLAAELAPRFDALERRLALEPCTRHNANNRVIVEGARALGIHAAAMPRNAPADCGEGCGYCGFGCSYAKKRSTPRVFLADVVAGGGAIYARATAQHVMLAGRRARGVLVEQVAANGDVRHFEVAADLVVVAGGTLRTPGILARSGIAHPLLGARLFLHPVAAALPEFDAPIDAFAGPMQSAYSDAYNYLDGNYGAKIESAPAHPGLSALCLPWEGRNAHASLMRRFRYFAATLALVRDRDPGRIGLDAEADIDYSVSPFDGEHLLAGLAGVFDIAFAAGARRVSTLHVKPIAIERDAWTTARRAALVEQLASIGVGSNRQPFFSAHQMGTAAMGADPARSVVDPGGRVWGYENLLVADASLFPQASGVNPMLTIMAMAARVAEQHGAAATAAREESRPAG